MRVSLSSFAAGAVAALVLGSSAAYAATGGNFILGKSNSAGTTTVLSSGHGPALALKASGPALKVSNTSKVANLNADSLDGLSSSAFARTAGRTGAYDATGAFYDADKNGVNDTIIASASCPAGTQRTGGGAMDLTTSGIVFANIPDTGNAWTVAVSISETTTEDPTNVTASVVCYNPNGSLPGAYRTTTQGGQLAPAERTQLLTKARALAGSR